MYKKTFCYLIALSSSILPSHSLVGAKGKNNKKHKKSSTSKSHKKYALLISVILIGRGIYMFAQSNDTSNVRSENKELNVEL